MPPVLDVTRPVVVPYMDRLKAATLEAAAAPAARGRLHFLDFFDALLTGSPADGDKRSLRAEYALDGVRRTAGGARLSGRPRLARLVSSRRGW